METIKIKEIAAEDCILFMSVMGSQMKNAMELMNSWGFRYNTVFLCWIKTNWNHHGQQVPPSLNYKQTIVEYILMGVRGHVFKFKKKEEGGGDMMKAIYNVHFEDDSQQQQEHDSRKSIKIKEIIDEMFLDVPRIELFSRRNAEGDDLHWDYFGKNQVPKLKNNDKNGRDDKQRNKEILSKQTQVAEKLSLNAGIMS